MITRVIENCFRHAREKGWEKTYWAIDVHGTILKPNYKINEISKEFYPHAKEILQSLTRQTGIVMILYTCSYPQEIEQYLDYFAEFGIRFHYVNQNPDIANGGYGYYANKFYFNVLMDDKAGFDAESDWEAMRRVLKQYGIV